MVLRSLSLYIKRKCVNSVKGIFQENFTGGESSSKGPKRVLTERSGQVHPVVGTQIDK